MEMTESLSMKAIGEAIASFWGRSALFLWCPFRLCDRRARGPLGSDTFPDRWGGRAIPKLRGLARAGLRAPADRRQLQDLQRMAETVLGAASNRGSELLGTRAATGWQSHNAVRNSLSGHEHVERRRHAVGDRSPTSLGSPTVDHRARPDVRGPELSLLSPRTPGACAERVLRLGDDHRGSSRWAEGQADPRRGQSARPRGSVAQAGGSLCPPYRLITRRSPPTASCRRIAAPRATCRDCAVPGPSSCGCRGRADLKLRGSAKISLLKA